MNDSQFESIGTFFEDITNRINENRAILDKVEDNLPVILDHLSTGGEDIGVIKSFIGEINDRLGGLEERVSSIEEDVTRIKNGIPQQY